MTHATTLAPAAASTRLSPGALHRRLWQCAVGSVLVLLLIASSFILRDNLQRLGLSVGFDLLQRPAGFQIGVSLLPYAPTDSIAYAILVGALNTVMLVVLAGICATVLGVAIGLARRSVNPLVRGLALGYVELLRNTPLLMQILLWSAVLLKLPPAAKAVQWAGLTLSQRGIYFPSLHLADGRAMALAISLAAALAGALVVRGALRRLRPGAGPGMWNLIATSAGLGVLALGCVGLGVFEVSVPVRRGFNFQGGASLSPEFAAMLIALTLYFAAFIAEIVRNGVDSVARGQWEASQALGLSGLTTLREVVFPQALRMMAPALIAQYVSLIKNSSLAIAIGYPDLFWSVFTTINITGHAIEGVLLLAGAYLVLTLGTSWVLNLWYARLCRKG